MCRDSCTRRRCRPGLRRADRVVRRRPSRPRTGAPAFIERAEILKDKGTNLRAFMKGQVDKYTWVDVGSSYAPSGILAAFLLGQLERINKITRARQEISDFYRLNLGPLRERGYVQLPHVPQDCRSSYHLFYLLLESSEMQRRMLEHLRQDKIQVVFHYVPLHSSPMGKKFGYREGMLPVTESISARLVRLPASGIEVCPRGFGVCQPLFQVARHQPLAGAGDGFRPAAGTP